MKKNKNKNEKSNDYLKDERHSENDGILENDNASQKSKVSESDNASPSVGRKIFYIAELVLLIAIIVLIPILFYKHNPDIVENFKSVKDFDAWISGYKNAGIIVYLVCQVMQIVISVLPGQVIQIAGGYIFGFLLTFILTIVGAFVGTAITFYLAKLLGKNAVKVICGEERYEKYQKMMKTKKAMTVVFLIYLIPGLPKDIVSYIAGATDVDAFDFFIISLAGRTPAMSISILMGVLIYGHNFISAAIVAAAIIIIVLICIIKRKKLTAFLEKLGKTHGMQK